MQKSILFFVFLAFSTLVFSQNDIIISPKYKSIKQELDKKIVDLMNQSKVAGISIALIDSNEVVWMQGYGFADKENQIPANSQTCYRMASISKLFTATGIMQEVEKGNINIDAPYKIIIPEFSINSDYNDTSSITLKNLMTHHSGLPGDIYNGFFTTQPDYFTKAIDLLKYQYAAYPPNYVFSYSNIGISLVGTALEKVSEMKFSDYEQKNIFEPLEMTNTSFVMTDDIKQKYSKSYMGKNLYDEPEMRDIPAGGLISNVEDLSKFVKMVFANGRYNNKQIIKPETLQFMLEKQNNNVPLDFNFDIGIAWFLSGSDDIKYAGKFAGHGGDTQAFHSTLSLLTDKKLGVIVITNSSGGIAIKEKIANEILEKAVKIKSGLQSPLKEKARKFRDDEKINKNYEGTYISQIGVVKIKVKKHKLKSSIASFPVVLYPNNEGSFLVKLRLFWCIPITIVDKGLDFFEYNNQMFIKINNTPVAQKIDFPKIENSWKIRQGSYKTVNSETGPMQLESAKIKYKNKKLILTQKYSGFQKNNILFPKSENHALCPGIGRGMNESIYFTIDDNGDDILNISGFELRKVKK